MRFLNFFPVHLKLLSIRTRDTHVHPRLVAGGWARPSLLLAGRLCSKQRGFICSGAGGHEKACPPMRGLSPAAPGPRPLCADGLTVTLLQPTNQTPPSEPAARPRVAPAPPGRVLPLSPLPASAWCPPEPSPACVSQTAPSLSAPHHFIT